MLLWCQSFFEWWEGWEPRSDNDLEFSESTFTEVPKPESSIGCTDKSRRVSPATIFRASKDRSAADIMDTYTAYLPPMHNTFSNAVIAGLPHHLHPETLILGSSVVWGVEVDVADLAGSGRQPAGVFGKQMCRDPFRDVKRPYQSRRQLLRSGCTHQPVRICLQLTAS